MKQRLNLLPWCSRLLLLSSLVWASLTVWLAWRLQWSGPFRDLWEVMPLIEKAFAGEWYWPDFWAAYGGAHRLVIPRFLFAVEYRFFGGENRFILLVSLGCQLLTALLLWLRLRKTWPQQPTLQTLGTACILLTLFCGTQLFNFNYSYDTQWFQAMLFSVIALLLATSPTLANTPKRHLSGMILAALLASLSNMAGLLVWPVLAWLIFCSQLKLSWRFGFTALAIATVLLFMLGAENDGFQRIPDATPVQLLAWLFITTVRMLHFTGLYLGSPLTRYWPEAGSVLAWVLAFWVLRDGWRASRHQMPDRSFRLFCAGLALQIVLIGLATAWGRIFYPATMALAERYQTAILMFWLAVALASLAWLYRQGWHKAMVIIPIVLASSLMGGYYRSTLNGIHLSHNVHAAHLAAALGITDMSIVYPSLSFPAINNNHHYLAWHDDFLRHNRLAYFRQPGLDWLGKPMPTTAIRPDCDVNILRTKGIEAHAAAMEISGHFQCSGKQPAVIALLDEQNTVIGLALPQGPWVKAEQWRGYTRSAFMQLRAVVIEPQAASSP